MSQPNPASPLALPADVLQALHSFRQIVRSIKLQVHDVQAATGLSSSQLWCLCALNAAPGLRVSELADTLGVRQASASNLLDGLERRGLLERRRDSKDQRVVRLFLTPAGLDKAALLPQPASGVLPEALNRLEPPALAHLNSLLNHLIVLMQAEGGGSVSSA